MYSRVGIPRKHMGMDGILDRVASICIVNFPYMLLYNSAFVACCVASLQVCYVVSLLALDEC